MRLELEWIIGTILLILVLAGIASAQINIDNGENYVLGSYPVCVGDLQIKVRQQLIKQDYFFYDCVSEDNIIWTCPCTNNYDLNLYTQPKAKNVYDFVVQYSVASKLPEKDIYTPDRNRLINEANIRTKNYNNIVVGNAQLKTNVSRDNIIKIGVTVALIVILILILIVYIIIYIYKYIKEDDEEGDGKKDYMNEL